MKKNNFTIKTGMSFLLTILGLQSCKIPSKPDLPPEFRQYAELNSDFKSDKFEVILLAESENYGIPHPIRLFHSVKNQAILEVQHDENSTQEGYHYYKLDKDANIIDSLHVPFGKNTGFINEYMVQTPSIGDCNYTTWPLNGDTTSKKIEILNHDLSWKEQKVNQTSEEIIANSTYYFYDIACENGAENMDWCTKKLFFCRDGKWEVLYTKVEKIAFRGDDSQTSYNRYRENFFLSSNDENPNAKENFELKYFHKEEEIKYVHSIGGGSPGFSKKGWVGTGYFNVPILNDVLKIKKQNLFVEEGKPSEPKIRYYLSNGKGRSVTPFNLNIFTNPDLNYALYATSAYYVYAIRKKGN